MPEWGTSATAEFARLDREQSPARGSAGGDAGGHRPDAVGARREQAERHHDRVARALRGHARLADELVVPERAGHQVEQVRADQGLLLAEVSLARLADRAHAELVVEDQEGRRLARQRVARAGEDHPHPAAGADALAQLRPARWILSRMAAARAETDRLRPPAPGRSPRPVDPD